MQINSLFMLCTLPYILPSTPKQLLLYGPLTNVPAVLECLLLNNLFHFLVGISLHTSTSSLTLLTHHNFGVETMNDIFFFDRNKQFLNSFQQLCRIYNVYHFFKKLMTSKKIATFRLKTESNKREITRRVKNNS